MTNELYQTKKCRDIGRPVTAVRLEKDSYSVTATMAALAKTRRGYKPNGNTQKPDKEA